MRTGKLPEPVLKRSVLRQLHRDGKTGGYGADCAMLESGDGTVTLYASAGAAPGFEKDPGKLILSAWNDLAAAGAEPEAFLVQAVLPAGGVCGEAEASPAAQGGMEAFETAYRKSKFSETAYRKTESPGAAQGEPIPFGEEDLRRDTRSLAAAAGMAGAEIIGGHTQISGRVLRPVYTVTGVGKAGAETCRRQRVLEPGQDLVVTRWIAMAGTAALALAHESELRRRYPFRLIDQAKALEKLMPVGETARALTHFGPAAVHSLAQGGIFNGLWEMAERADVGLEVDLKKIPVRQETIEICEYFDINPYYLYSAGTLLVGTHQGQALVSFLEAQNIPASVIGRVTEGRERVIRNGGDRRYLDRPKQEEWYRVFGDI